MAMVMATAMRPQSEVRVVVRNSIVGVTLELGGGREGGQGGRAGHKRGRGRRAQAS